MLLPHPLRAASAPRRFGARRVYSGRLIRRRRCDCRVVEPSGTLGCRCGQDGDPGRRRSGRRPRRSCRPRGRHYPRGSLRCARRWPPCGRSRRWRPRGACSDPARAAPRCRASAPSGAPRAPCRNAPDTLRRHDSCYRRVAPTAPGPAHGAEGALARLARRPDTARPGRLAAGSLLRFAFLGPPCALPRLACDGREFAGTLRLTLRLFQAPACTFELILCDAYALLGDVRLQPDPLERFDRRILSAACLFHWGPRSERAQVSHKPPRVSSPRGYPQNLCITMWTDATRARKR